MNRKTKAFLAASLLTSSIFYPWGTGLAADLTEDQQAVYDAVIAKLQLGEGPGVTIGENSSTKMDTSVAIGTNANANANSSNTAVGWNATATGIGHSAAYGTNSKALGEGSLAVGPEAEAYGKAGIAIGSAAVSNTETLNESSIAIGDRAKAKSSGSIGMGIESIASGKRSMAMGIQTQATGNYSMAIGGYTSASGADSVAIGHNAVATKSSSVAIGSKSVADRSYDTYGYTVDHAAFTSDAELLTYLGKIDEYNATVDIIAANKKDYDEKYAAWRADRGNEALRAAAEEAESKWVASQQALLKLTAAYKSYFGAVSVGTDFATRQIINVAAGSEDTDAVNVAQLKALNKKVDANKIEYVSINSTYEENKANDGATEVHSVAIGPQAGATSNSAIAIGRNAQASGSHSAAYGPDTKAMGQSSLAMGNYSIAELKNSTALGAFTNGIGTRSLAVGSHNVAAGHDSVAIGYGSLAFNGYIDKKAYDALSLEEQQKYFKPSGVEHYFLKEMTNGNNIAGNYLNTAVGSYARAFKHGVALGGISAAAENSTAIGTSAKANVQGAVSLGYNTKGTVENGVALGAHSIADREKGKIGYALGGDNSTVEKAMESTGQKVRYDELTAIIEPLKDEYNRLYNDYWNTPSGSDAEAEAKQKLDSWVNEHPDFLSATREKKQIIGTWQSGNGAVSIGSVGATRQITNVAAGSEDTDAVNVAQLKALNTKVDNNSIKYFSVKPTYYDDNTELVDETVNADNQGATGRSSMAIGAGATTNASNSIAIGHKATISDDRAHGQTAIGYKATASGQESVALGSSASADGVSVALGGSAKSTLLGVAVGYNAKSNGSGGISVGNDSESNFRTVAVGVGAQGKSESSVAVGSEAATFANASVATGSKSAVYGSGSIAIGTEAVVKSKVITPDEYNALPDDEKADYVGAAYETDKFGQKTPTQYMKVENSGGFYNGMAIGTGATVSSSNGMALGAVSRANGENSVAVGRRATSNVTDGVALGAWSLADRESGVYGYTVDGITYDSDEALAKYIGKTIEYQAANDEFNSNVARFNEKYEAWQKDPNNEQLRNEVAQASNAAQVSFEKRNAIVNAYKSGLGAVSVGNAINTRQITGVAAGSEDTDAVNVAQLKALNTKVDANKIEYVSINSSEDENKANDGATGLDSVAIGPKANATKEGAVAIGRNVEANGGVAIGENASSSARNSVAIGLGAIAGNDLQSDVAIGSGSKAAGYSVAIGNGASSYMDPNPEFGNGSGLGVAVGSSATVTGPSGVAVGFASEATFEANALGASAKATSRGAIAIGDTTKASGSGSVVLGNRAEANGTFGIAIGTYTKGLGSSSIGIGGETEATGNWSMAVGRKAIASADLSTSVGPYSNVTSEKSTAVGSWASAEDGKYATAVGYYARTRAGSSVALGSYSIASDGASMALGYDSAANVNTGVALGSYSIADRGSKVEGYNVDGLTFKSDAEIAAYLGKAEAYQTATEDFNAKLAVYNNKKAALEADPNNEQLKNEFAEAEAATQASFEARNAIIAAYRSTLGAISVGSDLDTRQITNVAAGSEDTDAVNLAQLKALNTKVDANKIEYVSINSSEEGNKLNDGAVAKDTIAIGPNVKTSVEAGVAIGRNIDSKGGVAVGEEAYSSSRHSVAIGYGAIAGDTIQADVAIGDGAKARAYSVAIGNGADAFMDPDPESNGSGLAVAIGSGAKVKGQGSVAIGSGALAEFSSSAMGIDAKANGRNAVSIGDRSNATGNSTVAIGTEAKTDSVYGVAIGPTAKGLGFGSVGIGGGAEATANWSMAMGQKAVASAQLGTALGHYSNVSSKNSTAIGSYARATGGTDATAVGYKAQTTAGSSVALGAYSVADRAGGVYGYTVDGVTLSTGAEVAAYLGKIEEYQAANEDFNAKLAVFNEKKAALANDPNNAQLKAELNEAGAATQASFDARDKIISAYRSGSGAVSVGTAANTRQIINVAAGSEDTDAVNVAQLKKVSENVNKGWTLGVSRLPGAVTNESEANGEATTITPGGEVVLRAERGIKLNQDGKFVDIGLKFIDMDLGGNPTDADAKASGGASLAVGQHSIADGHQSTAVGWFTHAGANAFAGGTSADASGDYSIAIGSNAKATATGTVAIGSGKRIDENNPASDYRKVDSEWGIAVGDEAAVDNQSKAATATGYRSEVSTSEWGSAYGATSKVTGSKLGTSIGSSAEVKSSENGTSIGSFAKVTSSRSGTAMGVSAKVENSESGTVLGSFSNISNSAYGIAIGPSAKVTNSHSGMAIGSKTNVNNANYGMAIGINSSVTNQGGVALGYGAVVSELSGVALGLGAVANRNAEVYGYSPDGTTFTDDASIAAYLGKMAEFESANQDYVENVKVYQEKLAAYQQNPTNQEALRAFQEASNNMTASFNKRTSIIAAYKPSYGAVSVGGSGATRQIINVAAGTENTDAVNLAQLKTVETIAKAHTELTLDGKSATAGENSEFGNYIGENNLTMAVKDVNGQKVYDLKLSNQVVIGQPGKDGKDGTPGSIGLVGPQGPAGEDGQPGKNAYAEISVKNGVDGVDGKHGKDGITRIVYEDENGEERVVATMDDGLKFAGDTENVTIAKKLNETLTITGGISDASLLTDNNIGVVAEDKGGLTVKLAKNLNLSDGSVAFAETAKDKEGNTLVKGEDGNWYADLTDAVYDADSQTYTKDGETLQAAPNPVIGAVKLSSMGLDNGNQRIVNVATGIDGTDAVNVDQLDAAISKVSSDVGGAHTELTLDGKSATAGADGALGEYIGENNLTMAVKDVNGQKVYDLKLKNEVVIGQPGKDGKDGTPGSIGLVGPQGPAGEDGQPGKNAYAEISVKNGVDGVDGANGKDGMTRIVYVDENDKEHTVATLEDGLKFAGDTKDVTIAKKLNETLTVTGGISETSLLTDNNIGVVAQDKGGLTVKLAKNINLSDGSVAFVETAKDADGNALVKGEDGNWYTDLTDAVYDADAQSYTKNGEVITAVANPVVGTVKLTSNGLDNGNQRITNVAAGVQATDAVNMSQLNDLTTKVDSNKIEYVSIKSSETENKLNDGATGDNSIAIGPKTKVTAASAVATGYQSEISNSNFGSAYGATSKVADSEQGTAIGYGTLVDNSLFGTALGTRANVTNSLQGTAVGQSAIVSGSNYGTSLGTFSKVINSDSGIAIGSMANVNNANYGMAIGINSSVTNQGGTALGYGTSVTEKSGVALGLGAVANRSAEVYGYSPDGVTFTDDASVAAYLGKTAEFEQANQNYVEKVQIVQEKLAAYQQNPRDPNAIQAYVDAANAMTESFEKRTGIIAAYKPSYGAVSVGGSGATRQIINVAAGSEDTDAVNLAQLKTVETIAKAHTELTLDGKSATAGADGALGDYIGENNLTMAVKDVNGQKVYDLKLSNEVVIGQPGKDGKDGTPGSIGLVGPQGPAGEDGQPGKNAYGEISVKNGVDGVDGTNGKDGMTRIVYVDENDKEHTVATLEDGLKFAGDTENVTIAKKLNETLTVTGGISDESLLTDNNNGVVAKADGGLTVKLAKNLNLSDGSVAFAETAKDKEGNALVKGEDGNWYTDLTDAVYDADSQTYTKDGEILQAAPNPVIGAVKLSSTGLDNGNQRIVNVATGIDGTDAVNVDQLDAAISKVSSDVGGAHTELTLDGKSATAGADGALGDYIGENNLTMAVKDVNGQKVYDLKLKNEVVIGQPGKDGKDGTPGSIGLVGPQGPAGEDGQPGKNAYAEISVKNGVDGVDGKHGKDGITRIVYEDENGEEHTVATLDDGLKFSGDTENVTIAKKLNETLEVKGGISDASLLTDNNIGVVAKADGGLTVKLAKNLNLADGSVRIGGTTDENGTTKGGIYIANQKDVPTTKDGKTEDGLFITGLTNTKWNPDANGIVSGRAATEDQLNAAISKVSEAVGGAHTELMLDGKSATSGADGKFGDYIGDNNLTMAVKDVNGQKVYDLKLKNEVVIGQPGKDGKDGTPGSIGLVGPQGPAGEDGQPGKNAYGEISVKNGADGVDGTNGKDGMTRIVYVDENDKEHTVATLEDGLKFAGDTENVTIPKKLNETLEVKGGISDASLLTDNNVGVVAKADGGLTVKLAKNLNLNDGSVRIGGTTDESGVTTGGIYIASQKAVPTTKDGKTEDGLFITGLSNTKWNPDTNGIVSGRAATEDQLNTAISNVVTSVGGAHTELTLDGKSATAGADGELGKYIGENNLTMAVKDVNGQKVYDLKLSNEVVIGTPGKDGKDGTPGSIGLVGPQGPAGEDGQPGKNAYGEISVKNGADGVDGTNGKDGMTRIVYVDENDKEHTVATLEDGLKFAGDTENVTIAKKLNETLEIKGGITDTSLLTDNNIGVVAQDKGGLTVKLAKNLNLNDGSVRIGGTIDENGVTTGGIYIANQKAVPTTKDGKTEDGLFITGLSNTKWNPDANGIVSGRAATEDQLNAAISNVVTSVGGAHTELTLDGKSATAGSDGELGDYIGENNLTMAVKDVNGQKVYDLKLSNEVVIGTPGKDGKDGTPGSIGLVGPQGPAGEDGQPGKNTYGEISVKNGVDGVDGTNGKDGMTRIIYVDENDKEHTVATLEDGLKFAGDTADVTIPKKLNETLEVKGGISDASLLTDNNIGVVAKADGGLTVKLAKNLKLNDGSVRIGGTTAEDGTVTGGIYIANQKDVPTTKDGKTEDGLFITGLGNTKWDPDANGIVSGRAATEDQLNTAISNVVTSVGGAHTELTLDGKSATAGADGKLGDYIGDNNLTMAVKDVNGQKIYDLKLSNEVVIGTPGKDGKDGTPGSIGLVGPQGPAGEDGQPGKNAYGEISVKNGADGVDGTNGKDGMTRIVYVDENDKEHTVATLEDGLKFAGDTKDVTIAKKLNETLEVKGGISDASLLTDNNIGVVAKADGGLTVKLAKNVNLSDGSVTITADSAKDADGNWLVKGEDGNWYTDLTDAVYDAATQTYTKDGATLTAVANPTMGSVKLSSTGLDNGNQRIVNVAPGKLDTDAVNMAQLRKIAEKTDHHNRVTIYGKSAEPGEDGKHGEYIKNLNLTMGVKEENGQLIHDIQLSKFIDLEEGQLTFTPPQDENNPTFRQAADANTSQVTLSAAGLDSGNQRIINVADGVDDKDAVNVSQLKANKVTLTAGDNVKITPEKETDGSTNYTIASTDTITGLTNTKWDPDANGIVSGRAATEDQLNAAISNVVTSVGGAHTELTLDGKSATAGADGALGEYIGDNNLTMAVKDVNGQKVYDLKLSNEIVIGTPGKDGKDGKPGSIGLVGPQGPAGQDGQPGKNAYGEISVKNGADGVDGTNGKDGMTRIVYVDENDKEHTVATLEDGLKFAGDTKDVTIAKKLNETLTVTGGISDASLLSDDNIGVVAQDKGGLTVKLAKNLNLADGSVRIGGTTADDGSLTGGIYIANQKAVPTTKENTTEDGLFITGLANTDWNPEANGIVENRAASEKQLKAVADSSARVDATNLSDDNVNSWKTKLGITDTLLSDAGAWKLTVNGTGERAIKKDSVINFVNGEKVQITQEDNNIKVGLDSKFVEQVTNNTKNITDLDNRVTKVEGDITKINNDITNINTSITNINNQITDITEGKVGVANVVGDTETGVKVEKVDANDATKGVKVSLEEKIKVGGITIDGKAPAEGETASRTITGLTNTTWDADKVVEDRAATEGQLKDFAETISQSASPTKINGDDNINAVKVEGKNEYNLSLSDDLKVGNSISVDNMTYISKDGINANDKEIKNVKAVELTADGTSAATTGQVYTVREELTSAIGGVALGVQNNARQISKLDSKINKSGAGAAALAALHPLDYDPDNKWNFTAGVGTYHGSNAMAVGAFYRPNEDLLFSVGGSMGNGENMMNMGVSMKFGNSNPYASMSKGRLIEYVEQQTSEIDALKAQNESQNERIQKLEELVNSLIAG
ncbi:MAG: YadA-like family protein [Veillonella sp.]|uniref:YadA-like family protein n=1 Tax=Veillonella sp. TaxID=1926307 RepID=UPI0025DA0E76|nr:YadA-like family protein [Veillonella sp.]MBS4913346.1 YadA-like family protein [Veillonella sp.]